jgi:hypothetical protein
MQSLLNIKSTRRYVAIHFIFLSLFMMILLLLPASSSSGEPQIENCDTVAFHYPPNCRKYFSWTYGGYKAGKISGQSFTPEEYGEFIDIFVNTQRTEKMFDKSCRKSSRKSSIREKKI